MSIRRPGLVRALGLVAGLVCTFTVGCGQAAPNSPSTSSDPTPARPPQVATSSPAPRQTAAGSSTPPRTATASSALPQTVSPSPDKPSNAHPPATPGPARPSCADLASSLTRREQIGQLLMVGISSQGLGSPDAQILGDVAAGSVILLGNSTVGVGATRGLSASVRSAAGGPEGVRTMLTVDQEGGQVQRLQGSGFDRIPSANRQARLSDAQLAQEAKRWGEQLRKAGIDANLAPVADVVPEGFQQLNQPIGVLDRGYGSDPAVVAAKASAFIRGMDQAGIATAVKHFPGLGRVRGNTDFEAKVVDRTTTRQDEALAGFREGVSAGVDMVMVSSAIYASIDPDHRAAFSTVILQRLIRGDLGYTGVIISDDLAARAIRDIAPGQRAVRFFEAGGDLAIVGDPTLAPQMVRAVSAAMSSDRRFAQEITRKASRVIAMKARRGLADCA